MGSFEKLKKILFEKNKFLIIGHCKPDGDSIASMLSLGQFLESTNKKVDLICKDRIPEIFNFLPRSDKIGRDFLLAEYDVVIMVDNGDSKRVGFWDRISQKKGKITIVNIDHHPKNDLWRYADVNYVEDNASSTSEIICSIFSGVGYKISPSIATMLLCGIYTDTGGFQYANTSNETMQIVAKLLSCGAKLKNISGNVNNFHSVSKLKLWGKALSNLDFCKKFGIAAAVLTKNDIKNAKASEDEVSGLVNILNSIPEAKVVMLLYETDDGKIRGSLRSEGNEMDVSVLAKNLGGGGHKRAAGFTVEGKIVKDGNGWKIV
jgi:bifunctional oligoribonuclease and PAP phosphatase NrnA